MFPNRMEMESRFGNSLKPSYLHHPCTLRVSVICLTCSSELADVIISHYSHKGTQLNERHFSILGSNVEAAFPEMTVIPVIPTCQSAKCVWIMSVMRFLVPRELWSLRKGSLSEKPSRISKQYFTNKMDTAFPETAGTSRAACESANLWKSTLKTQANFGICLVLLHVISFLHVCTKGSSSYSKQLFILCWILWCSCFAGEILGVIIGLLFNPAKQRGRLGRELLEQRNYV